jgi:hypothetical protein
MSDPFRSDTIDNWVGDFCESDAFRALDAPAREYASEILPAFLRRACEERDREPGELEEGDLKPALLEGVGLLELPPSARKAAPELCAALLAELEAQGRLAEGRALGRYVRALREAFEIKPIRNPGARIGRNAPCPCGSGRKYKHCCLNREI